MAHEWAVGLMTGTVLDGNIDVALLRTDGETVAEFGPFRLAPYGEHENRLIADALATAQNWQFADQDPEIFAQAEQALTLAQARAVEELVAEAGLKPIDVAAVGFHGQTVLHRAPQAGRNGRTRQLGDGALMAERLGITVVNDFRSADMAAGGQGAPLSAVYHRALMQSAGMGDDTAILNLGGVGNVTATGPNDTLIAFDTGPANAPVNDWVKRHGLGEMDRDGQIAASGVVDMDRLAALLDHAWFSQPFPKSLDRNSFTAEMAEGLSAQDGAALLTAFSAAAVGKGLDLLPRRPDRLIVCGGGRRNPSLMRAIGERADVKVESAEDHGWRGDAIEAECFAFLAMRRLHGLPISIPGTTGVPSPMTGGVVHQARQ
ncbi:anhydro-N-acetylmuramic acid kinase [Cucumibacter marinus]|uniref:anhydro-N-acetylmuramic acid kinase n=1 Tax=Cucumibacter marinus TaxID=1121252 RepID=UPI0004141F94|nr:anhydro-N-acetylmuramic acid kinase [Cucumibacter marinus]